MRAGDRFCIWEVCHADASESAKPHLPVRATEGTRAVCLRRNMTQFRRFPKSASAKELTIQGTCSSSVSLPQKVLARVGYIDIIAVGPPSRLASSISATGVRVHTRSIRSQVHVHDHRHPQPNLACAQKGEGQIRNWMHRWTSEVSVDLLGRCHRLPAT
jgi:hypothetical protein